jgi:hypothetical protein
MRQIRLHREERAGAVALRGSALETFAVTQAIADRKHHEVHLRVVPVRLLGEAVRETDALDEAPGWSRERAARRRLPGSAASAARAPGTCSQAALCDMSPLPRLSSTSTWCAGLSERFASWWNSASRQVAWPALVSRSNSAPPSSVMRESWSVRPTATRAGW